jgi:hypothetical protein
MCCTYAAARALGRPEKGSASVVHAYVHSFSQLMELLFDEDECPALTDGLWGACPRLSPGCSSCSAPKGICGRLHLVRRLPGWWRGGCWLGPNKGGLTLLVFLDHL